MGLFNIPKLSFNNSAPRVVNGSYEPEFKAFYTGMANLKLRNVYIRNTADNVSQLDNYLNQKATTFKKLETGDANQWVQYSFTMSDEEFNELVNRNNNLRMYFNGDSQLATFAQEDISIQIGTATITGILPGDSQTYVLIPSSTFETKNVYLSYFCLTSKISSKKDFGVAEWDLGFGSPARLNGFLFQETKFNLATAKLLNNFGVREYLLWVANTGSVPTLEAEAYLLYYTINKA